MLTVLLVVSCLSLGCSCAVAYLLWSQRHGHAHVIDRLTTAVQQASRSPVPPPWLERLSPYVPDDPPRCIVCGYAIKHESFVVRGGIVHQGHCRAIYTGLAES